MSRMERFSNTFYLRLHQNEGPRFLSLFFYSVEQKFSAQGNRIMVHAFILEIAEGILTNVNEASVES